MIRNCWGDYMRRYVEKGRSPKHDRDDALTWNGWNDAGHVVFKHERSRQ